VPKWGVVLALGLVGCGEGVALGEDHRAERAAVLNGELSGPEEDGVVSVTSVTEGLISRTCTGTLVAPNLIVTAQHCLSNFEDGFFSCTNDGELGPGSTAGLMGTPLDPAVVEVRTGVRPDAEAEPAARGFQTFVPQTTSICQNDIGLLVLDRDLEGLPLHPMRLTSGTAPGDRMAVTGYGVNSFEPIGPRYRREDVRIAQVGVSEFRPEGGGTAPRTFMTEGPLLCAGDSGGPAFSETGALIGVFSRVVGDCQARMARDTFTEVAPFANDVILPAFEAVGATPIFEETPGGEGGAGGEGAGAGGSDAGAPGSGGESPAGSGGSVAGSGSAGLGGDAGSAGAPVRRGLRQEGGCRCDVVGAEGSRRTPFLAAFVVLGALLRRRVRFERRG